PLRVRIRTRGPFPNLLSRLHYGFVLPKAVLATIPVPTIGTGPWRIESHRPGQSLVLARNPHWRGPPSFEEVEAAGVPDGSARVRRVLAGGAQLAESVPLAEGDALRREPRVRVQVAPGLRVLYLALRTAEAPFSDPRVREAVDLAIDRDELVARVLFGH